MDYHELVQRFKALTTPHLADACLRSAVPVRCAPAGLKAVVPGSRVAGPVAPVRHVGSIDIYLEALKIAHAGDILVVDNGGRLDEACVGDLAALEVQLAGLGGIVIWGLHRDSVEIAANGLSVFSLGSLPVGPQRLDARPLDALQQAQVGNWTVGPHDLVLGDDDGVLFLPSEKADEVFDQAETIRDTEQRQALRMKSGEPLRNQMQFENYLARRQANPALTFREHLRTLGGAIEE